MANPQKENGHTGISNELLDAIIGHRVSGVEFQCLLFIIRKTYGWNKKIDMIPLSQFSKATGHKRQNIRAAIKSLECKNIIAVMKIHDREALKYSVNKDFETWQPVMKKHSCNEKSLQTVMKNHVSPVMNNHAIKRHIKNTTKESNGHFLKFWEIYPKKNKKKDAERIFNKINPCDELFEKIVLAIRLQGETQRWKAGYIPDPTTWLNQERWNDDPKSYDAFGSVKVKKEIWDGAI